MLPPGLAKVFSLVSGMKWPEANEDDLRTAGDDYLAIGNDMPELRGYIVELIKSCKREFEGEAADQFEARMLQLIGGVEGNDGVDYLKAAEASAKELGEFAHKVANQVEYTKWMIIGQLIQLLAQIAWAIANIPLTFGASLATIFAAREAAAQIIKQVFLWLLRQIALHEFLSVTTGLMLDVIIQGIQIGKGHRKEWDGEATLQTLKFAAINGLIAGPLELLTFGFGKLFGKLFGGSIGNLLRADLKGLTKGLGGAAGNVAKNDVKALAGGVLKGDLKAAAGGALKGDLKAAVGSTVKKEAGAAAAGAAKGATKTVGGKAAGAEAKAATGKAVAAETGAAVAKDAEKKLSNAEKFTQEMGRSFEESLSKLGIGKEVANQAGQNFAKTLATNGARYAVDQQTVRKLLDTVLKGASKEEQKVISELAQRTMNLASGLRAQTGLQLLYKLGEGIGMYVKGGVQNILTEGTYNAIYSEDHEFHVTWESFVAGVSMGAITHFGHEITAPLQLKFQNKVQKWDAKSAATSDDPYYGPFHTRTLLALAANLSGHPTSLWIPRPMGPKARAALGLDTPTPVGTESSGKPSVGSAHEPKPGAETSQPRTSSEGNTDASHTSERAHTGNKDQPGKSRAGEEDQDIPVQVRTATEGGGNGSGPTRRHETDTPEPSAPRHDQTASVPEQPRSSVGRERPEPVPVPEQPRSSVGRERPEPVPVPEQPRSSVGRDRSEPVPVPEQPRSSAGRERPEPVPVPEQPRSSAGRERPEPVPVPEQPRSSVGRERPEPVPVPEQPRSSVGRDRSEPVPVPEQPRSSVGHQGSDAAVDHGPAGPPLGHEKSQPAAGAGSTSSHRGEDHDGADAQRSEDELAYLESDESGTPEYYGQPLESGARAGWFIGREEAYSRVAGTLRLLPVSESHYRVVMHTDANGGPTQNGQPMRPEVMADLVRGLEQNGHLPPGRRTVEFVACDFGRASSTYVQEVMDRVWANPRLRDIRAVAADGPVWVAPGVEPGGRIRTEAGSGHVVVASKVGFDPTGRPVVEGGGSWREYVSPLSAEGLVRQAGDRPPVHEYASDLPVDYTAGTVTRDMKEAVAFGTDPKARFPQEQGRARDDNGETLTDNAGDSQREAHPGELTGEGTMRPGDGPSADHTAAGAAYRLTPAPEHARADAADPRHEQWEQAQRDLQDTYDAKLAEAAEKQQQDPDGSGRPHDTEAEEALGKSLAEGPVRFPEDAPADLPVLVRQRARDLMYAELEARPEERAQILAGLDGITQLASVREAAVRVAMQRFEHTVTEWSAPPRVLGEGDGGAARHRPAELPAATVDLIRREASAEFRTRAEEQITRIYATAEHLTAASNAEAARTLDRMAEHLSGELDHRAGRELLLDRADRIVDRADGGWFDRIDAADRELLASAGVTERPELSPDSLTLIRESLRERLTAEFDSTAGPVDGAAGPRRDRRTAADLLAQTLAGHAEALPHEFAVQAAREAVIRRAAEETEKAADSWAGSEGNGERARSLGVTEHDVQRARATVGREVAEALDRRLVEHLNRPDRNEPDPALAEDLAGLTATAGLHDRLSHQGARLAVIRSAEEAARQAAGKHGGGLSADSADRVRTGHSDRIGEAFDRAFRTPADLAGPEAAGRHEQWLAEHGRLTDELPDRVRFEAEVMPALRDAAEGYQELAARHTLSEELVNSLRRDYGDDFFEQYRELWGPAGLDGAGWRRHQAAHEDVFGRAPERESGEAGQRAGDAADEIALALTLREPPRTGLETPDGPGRPGRTANRPEAAADEVAPRTEDGPQTDEVAPRTEDGPQTGEVAPAAPPRSDAPADQAAATHREVAQEAVQAVTGPQNPGDRTPARPDTSAPDTPELALSRVNQVLGGPEAMRGLQMSSGRYVGLDEPGHNMLADVRGLADRLTGLGLLDPGTKAGLDALHDKELAKPKSRRPVPEWQTKLPVGHARRLRAGELDLVEPVVTAAAGYLGPVLRPDHASGLGVRIEREVGPGAPNERADVRALAEHLRGRGRLGTDAFERLADHLDGRPTPEGTDPLGPLHDAALTLRADHLAGRLDLPAPDGGHRLVAAMGEPGLRMTWRVSGANPPHPASDFNLWATGARDDAPPLAESTTLNCWESVMLVAHHAGLLPKEWIRETYRGFGDTAWDAHLRDRLLPLGRTSYDSGAGPLPRAGDVVVFRNDLSHVALATGRTEDGAPLVLSFGVGVDGKASADEVALLTVDDVLLSQAEFGPGPWFQEHESAQDRDVAPRLTPTEPVETAVRTPEPDSPAPRMTPNGTPRFVVRSGFEARRFEHDGGPVTDLTVRVAFRDSGRAHDTADVWSKAVRGVEEHLNAPEYRLANGDRLHVTVVRAGADERPHLTVDLVGRDRGMDQRSWWPDAEPVDYAHELGHQLGLRDEYRTTELSHRPDVKGSLFGDYREPAPGGLRQGGLRDRHLDLISAVVGHLDTPATAGSHPGTWEAARTAATPHERSHVWVDPVSVPRTGAGEAAPPVPRNPEPPTQHQVTAGHQQAWIPTPVNDATVESVARGLMAHLAVATPDRDAIAVLISALGTERAHFDRLVIRFAEENAGQDVVPLLHAAAQHGPLGLLTADLVPALFGRADVRPPADLAMMLRHPQDLARAGQIRTALRDGSLDDLLGVISPLRQDLRTLWRVIDIYERGTGRPLLEEVRTRYPEAGDLTSYLMGGGVLERQVVDHAEVMGLFHDMQNLRYEDTTEGSQQVPFDFPDDGCFNRAHLMAVRLTELGVASQKVFVRYQTAPDTPGLAVASMNAADATANAAGTVRWDWHVAVVVDVDVNGDGGRHAMVLDPSMADRPLLVDHWIAGMGVRVGTSMDIGSSHADVTSQLTGFRNNTALETDPLGYPIGVATHHTTERHTYYLAASSGSGQPDGASLEASERHFRDKEVDGTDDRRINGLMRSFDRLLAQPTGSGQTWSAEDHPVELFSPVRVPPDGDCLYHAVNTVLFPGVPDALALRTRVLDWVLENDNLLAVTTFAAEHGTTINDLALTIGLTGNWNTAAGDLAPRVVASALGVRLHIHQNGAQTHVLEPLNGQQATRDVHLALAGDHYSAFVPDRPAEAEGGLKRPHEDGGDDNGTDQGGSAGKRARPLEEVAPRLTPTEAVETVVRTPEPDSPVVDSLTPRSSFDRTPRFVVRSGFEARRFEHDGGPVTDLTVRVALREGGGHDAGSVWGKAVRGVEEYLNAPGYRLANGDRLHVTVVRAGADERPHLTVDLVGRDRGMDQRSWWPDAEPVDYAHELGHQLGLRDEYRTTDLSHRPDVKGSLFGDYRSPAPDGLRQGGLRDRHLQLISSVVGHVEAPHVTGRHDLTFDQARAGAPSHERSHTWVDPVSDPLKQAAQAVARPAEPPVVVPQMFGTQSASGVSHPERWLIQQPGYASGDQFGISVALLHDRNGHVLIARGPQPGAAGYVEGRDKSEEIAAFYRSTGIGGDRIRFVDAPGLDKKTVWSALNHEAKRIAKEEWHVPKRSADIRDVTAGTDHVAAHFSPTLRETVREAWGLTDRYDPQIRSWLEGRGIALPVPTGRKVLVLWSRFTGKAADWSTLRGRMEHDTSFQGVRQILRDVAREYDAVVITGDPHPRAERDGKWEQLVAEMSSELSHANIHQITGFWRDAGPEVTSWTGNDRTGQLRLYDYLNRLYGVDHLGFRSGNLEAAALVGHRVTYLEDFGATGSDRMARWHRRTDVPDAITTAMGGMAPGYERALVSTPPTASGRHSKQFERAWARDNYQPPSVDAMWRKPVEVYSQERGFGLNDLDVIRRRLNLPAVDRAAGREAFFADRVEHLQRRYQALLGNVANFTYGSAAMNSFRSWNDHDFTTRPKPGRAEAFYNRLVAERLPGLPAMWTEYRRLAVEAYYQQFQQHEPMDISEVAPPAPPRTDPSGLTESPGAASSSSAAPGHLAAPPGAVPSNVARERYGLSDGDSGRFQQTGQDHGAVVNARPPGDLAGSGDAPGPHPVVDPRPAADQQLQPAVPPAPPVPLAPARFGEHRLGASDVLVSLRHDEAAVFRQLTEHFTAALPGERAAAQTLAESLFGGEVLRPLLSVLSRGDVREVPFSAGSWSGTIRITATVGTSVHRRTIENFEFEYGSEQQTTVGVTADGLWQANLGLQVKGKFGSGGDLTETLGYQQGWMTGTSTADAGRTLARGKTSETAAVFETGFRVGVEFAEAHYRGVPRPVAVTEPVHLDLTGEVAVPLRETGNAPTGLDLHFAVPHGIAEHRRLAGSHIVTDVWALDRPVVPAAPAAVPAREGAGGIELVPVGEGAGSAPAPTAGLTTGPALTGMAKVVAGFEHDAAGYFGDRWPELKAKLLDEIDLGTLHQDLKALMSGQELTVTLDSLTGPTAVVTLRRATVSRMQQVANLPSTEFNIGTGTARAHVEQVTGSKEWQTLPSSVGNGTGKSWSAGLGVAGRAGRDHVELRGSGDELSLSTKVKSPAVAFEGEARIEVRFGWQSRLDRPADATFDTTVGFRSVIDRDDAVPVPITVDPQTQERSQPPAFTLASEFTPPQPTPHLLDTSVPGPPDGVWPGPGHTGLPDGTTVRDLRDIAPLHRRLDEIGRAQLGERGWQAVRADVLQSFSHAAVSAHLVAMTRGSGLRTPEVTLGPLKGLHMTLTAEVVRMAHRRGQDSADLNPVREGGTVESRRYLRSDTTSGQIQGGGKAVTQVRDHALDAEGKPFKDGFQGGATVSREVRSRDGWRGGTSTKSYASGKYRSPQELYDTEVRLDLTVNGVRDAGDPVRIAAELSLERVHTAPRLVGADDLHGFTGPARTDHPAPPVAQPPLGPEVGRNRLGQSDVVLSFGAGDTAVLRRVEGALGQLGAVPAQLSARLARQLDPIALKAALSGLSRGGAIRIPVDHGNWTGTVVVTAALSGLRHRESVPGFEFELGSQQRGTTGFTWDRRTRHRIRVQLRGTLPHVTVSGEYAHTHDSLQGLTVDRTGGTGSRGKSVEEADVLAGSADFTVTFEPGRWSRRLPPITEPITVPVVVATPHREAVPPAPAVRLPGHRLGSSDIVTRVYRSDGTREDGTVHQVVADLAPTARAFLGRDWPGVAEKLAAELGFDRLHTQLKSLTSGHPIDVRHGRTTARITAEVGPLTRTGEAPQVEFNIGSSAQTSLTSSDGGTNTGGGHGDSLSLGALATTDPLGAGAAVVGGGNLTVARGVDRMEHRSDVTVAGTAVKTKLAADAYQAEVRIRVRFEQRPVIRLFGRDHDAIRPDTAAREQMFRTEDRLRAADDAARPQSPEGPVTPAPASPFQAVTRRLVRAGDVLLSQGSYRRVEAQAVIHADVLTETGRAEPVPSTDLTAGPLRPLPPAVPVSPAAVRRPPAALFTEGPRGGDVLRWLGDSSGVQDLLGAYGERFFGHRTWGWLEHVARDSYSHAQLSSLFGSVARGRHVPAPEAGAPVGDAGAPAHEPRDVVLPDGRAITTPSVGNRLFVADAGISATVSIVQLEHRGDSSRANLSPANDSTGGGRSTRLDWRQWNLQGQLGAQAGAKGAAEVTTSALFGGGHRHREGPAAGTTGKTVAGAKFPTEMARYTGYASVELTFRDGSTTRTERGLVPIEMEIPHSETTELASASNQRVLFSPLHPEGETISRGSTAEAVASALAAPVSPGIHWLADPAERQLSGDRSILPTLQQLPHEAEYFTIAYHGDPANGAPAWLDRPLPPAQAAQALIRLAASGQWQGEPLRFFACNSGRGGADSYAGQVLAEVGAAIAARRTLAEHLGETLDPSLQQLLPLRAYAPSDNVSVIPGDRARLVVAGRAGYDANGVPRVEAPGTWHLLEVAADGTIRVTDHGQELTVPAGTDRIAEVTEQAPLDPDRPPLVVLGDKDNGAEEKAGLPAATLHVMEQLGAPNKTEKEATEVVPSDAELIRPLTETILPSPHSGMTFAVGHLRIVGKDKDGNPYEWTSPRHNNGTVQMHGINSREAIDARREEPVDRALENALRAGKGYESADKWRAQKVQDVLDSVVEAQRAAAVKLTEVATSLSTVIESKKDWAGNGEAWAKADKLIRLAGPQAEAALNAAQRARDEIKEHKEREEGTDTSLWSRAASAGSYHNEANTLLGEVKEAFQKLRVAQGERKPEAELGPLSESLAGPLTKLVAKLRVYADSERRLAQDLKQASDKDTFGYQRKDAEVSVLNAAYAKMNAWGFGAKNSGVTGTFVVLSTKGTCDSCKFVVGDFKNSYPGIRIMAAYLEDGNVSNSRDLTWKGAKIEVGLRYGYDDVNGTIDVRVDGKNQTIAHKTIYSPPGPADRNTRSVEPPKPAWGRPAAATGASGNAQLQSQSSQSQPSAGGTPASQPQQGIQPRGSSNATRGGHNSGPGRPGTDARQPGGGTNPTAPPEQRPPDGGPGGDRGGRGGANPPSRGGRGGGNPPGRGGRGGGRGRGNP
ncbi:protein-glutamine glutaminase family protein [Streptomyces sp. CB01881]|uniref:protein-glutamine glutaminase family protein n=1 Tax=Streptomyces sp. CB01881 TaxID=2078691 RepID=UPI001F11F3A2|nr:protein-glutamine glutaminase family protein [Streptomyces sp. CB01881]